MKRSTTVFLGKVAYTSKARRNECTAEIEIRDTDKGPELSVCGTIWNATHTDHASGGQNIDELARLFPNDKRLARLREIWERWHLNGMRAGCEHQRAEKWHERPIDPSKPTNTYGQWCGERGPTTWNMLTWVTKKDHPQGLMCEPCPVCGYKYGTAWLHEPLPPEIIAELCEMFPGLKTTKA